MMLEYLAGNWGSWVSVLGVIVSSVGLGWAISEARRARNASQAARTAARETRSYIARHLQAVDLERAIALIQRIKDLHNGGRWQTAMEQYQPLRALLADIIARSSDSQTELRRKLANARTLILTTENFVGERGGQAIDEHDRSELNQSLNRVQSELEELASAISLGDSQGEAK